MHRRGARRRNALSIHVALNHVTHYRYDRWVSLSPQVVRLRPAPHCRTRILSYSLKVQPADHFINWQQDPQANYLARLVFPDPTREFRIEVDLVAEMSVLNPFDFFLAPLCAEFSLQVRPRTSGASWCPTWSSRRPPFWSPTICPESRASAAAPSISWSASINVSPPTSATSFAWSPACNCPRETRPSGRAHAGTRPRCWCSCCATWDWRRASFRATSSSWCRM